MTLPRVAIICDLLEENWPSMDLVGEMLVENLHRDHSSRFLARRVRPELRRRATRLPFVGGGASAAWNASALNVDRLLNRFGDYPRHLSRVRSDYDLFHLVDHSYSQLAHVLPAERTVITCHDLDTFRSVLNPVTEPRTALFRQMTLRILSGFRRAARVICDSAAIRDEIVAHALIAPERTVVIPIGVHPSCTVRPVASADRDAERLLGPAWEGAVDLLHVGSTMPRKRIDVLLRVFAVVRGRVPEARLIRVGGEFTPAQAALARELGVAEAILSLPRLDRDVLAAVYRRATLVLLPSDREGFGLPVVEALACGTPILASDTPVLRETGGSAAAYEPSGAVARWADRVIELLGERRQRPDAWHARRSMGLAQAEKFSWATTVDKVAAVYEEVLRMSPVNRS